MSLRAIGPTERTILRLLSAGDKDIPELREAFDEWVNVHRAVLNLRDHGLIHVTRTEPVPRGRPRKVWGLVPQAVAA